GGLPRCVRRHRTAREPHPGEPRPRRHPHHRPRPQTSPLETGGLGRRAPDRPNRPRRRNPHARRRRHPRRLGGGPADAERRTVGRPLETPAHQTVAGSHRDDPGSGLRDRPGARRPQPLAGDRRRRHPAGNTQPRRRLRLETRRPMGAAMSSPQETEAQNAFDSIVALDDKSVDNVYRNMQEFSPLAVASAAAAVAVGAAVEYQELELQNGWRHFGEPWAPARWRRLVNVVRLSGLVARDDQPVSGSVICHLPEGSRPDKNLVFMAPSDQSISRLDVFPDGTVVWVVYLVGGFGAGDYLSLSQISFSVGG